MNESPALRIVVRGLTFNQSAHFALLKPRLYQVPAIWFPLLFALSCPIAVAITSPLAQLVPAPPWIALLVCAIVLATSFLVPALMAVRERATLPRISLDIEERGGHCAIDFIGESADLHAVASSQSRSEWSTVANLGSLPGLFLPVVPLLFFPTVLVWLLQQLPGFPQLIANAGVFGLAVWLAWLAPLWTLPIWRTRIIVDRAGVRAEWVFFSRFAVATGHDVRWAEVERVQCDCRSWTLQISGRERKRPLSIWLFQFAAPGELVRAVLEHAGATCELGDATAVGSARGMEARVGRTSLTLS